MARLYLQEKVNLKEIVNLKERVSKVLFKQRKNIQIYHLFINAYREKQKVR